MTYKDPTIPRTDTETAPQSCDDDPCGLDDIPDFLRRTPQPAKLAGTGETMRATPGREVEQ